MAKKSSIKRMISLICALALLFSFVPSALAAPGDADNKALKVVTGAAQWEGVTLSAANMGLQIGNKYNFSFAVYTPDIPVGIVLQSASYTWIANRGASSFDQNDKKWQTMTGTWDLTSATATEAVSIVKMGDSGNFDSQVATFYIDDFKITDNATSEVVYSEDFQGSTHRFGSRGTIVAESTIVTEPPIIEPVEGATWLEVPSLKDTYKNRFDIGNIISPNYLEGRSGVTGTEVQDVLKYHYNVITGENDMKPEALSSAKGVYTFTNADKMVNWALENDIAVHGHTLVWHAQSPRWLNKSGSSGNDPLTRAEAKANLKEYIDAVAGHYAGKVVSWDVVNEAFGGSSWNATLGWRNSLRKDSPWYLAYANGATGDETGADYIYDAFVYARLADPNSVLYINDFNDHLNPNRTAIPAMAIELNEQWKTDPRNTDLDRLLVEGVGMQAHYWASESSSLINNVKAALDNYTAAGLKIIVSELDIPAKTPTGWSPGTATETDKTNQTKMYGDLFTLLQQYDAIERVTFWGMKDDWSWRGNSDGDAEPLPFSKDKIAKPSFYSIINAHVAPVEPPKDPKFDRTLTPMKDVYKDYFLIGNIVNPSDFGTSDFAKERYDMLKHHFNALTFENSMKPEAMWSDTRYTAEQGPDFSVDQYIKTLENDGFLLHGHTLSWHGQSGKWLNTGDAANYETAKANLKKYIDEVAGHYKDNADGLTVYSWDVLNEAVKRTDNRPLDEWKSHVTGAMSGTSPWYTAYANGGEGWRYVYDAFLFAREADPNAILYYNDYNMDDANKATIVMHMVNGINALYAEEHPEADGRLLIEGIGIQEHDSITTRPANVEASIQKFISTGAIIAITEMDVGVPGYTQGQKLSEEDEIKQALHYAKMFNVFKKYSENIERVTFWGVDDAHTWRPNDICTVFDSDYSAKLAYYAIIDPDGFIAEYDTDPVIPSDTLTSTATYGTPVIGGSEEDAIWETAVELPIERHLTIKNGATGVAKALWDKENLYVQIKVKDPVLNNSSSNAHEQDSVEIFFNETNSKSDAYADGMGQYRVSYTNSQSLNLGNVSSGEGFESVTKIIDGGYMVEMKLPFKFHEPTKGDFIGFDAQINDANDKGARQDVIMWSDTTGMSYANGSTWGSLELVSDATADPVLTISTDAKLVKKGDYFRVNAFFNEVVNSNTAVLNYVFDTSKFDFHGFTPADDVGLVSVNATDTGAKVTVMITNYNTKDYGEVLLAAKDSVDLAKAVNEISLNVDYVVKNDDGEKEIKQASASTTFKSTDDKGTGPNGEYTLIDLSNIIDGFGKTSADDDWDAYVYSDFDGDGEITIFDITILAQKI